MVAPIRVRLTLSHLVVIIIAMALSGFLLLSFLERYFLQATEESLIAQAQITAQALIPGALTAGPPPAAPAPAYNTLQQNQLSNISLQTSNIAPAAAMLSLDSADMTHLADASLQLSSQLATRIRILDARGIVLIDSRQEDQGIDLQTDSLVQAALAGQYASDTHKADRAAETVMRLALPVLIEDRVAGVVYLSQPLRDVALVLHDLRLRWLLSTIIALLLSGSVGLVLSQAIANPVHRLTIAAGEVARGQFDHQVPVCSRDELGDLSRAFNEMAARLKAARQMQTDFVANVSHELRTPLTSLKGMVETLRAGAVDDLAVRDGFLETMESETERLIRLVNDLLILSRADSEALNLRRARVDLAQLVHDVITQLTPQAAARQVALTTVNMPETAPVWGDADRLAQVLVNLLDNAIKYTRAGGAVTVKISAAHNQMICAEIHDEGIGIPAAELARIGQRFYRADKARTRGAGGSGLGLAIARALVEAHGGRLWVESIEGRGTTVSFTVPMP